MRIGKYTLIGFFLFTFCTNVFSQIDESQMGVWYMGFWSASFGESNFGVQGDIQHRNWNTIGDMEQLLIRGGLTFSPKDAGVKFTLGYGNVQTGAFGEDASLKQESRIYQEALFSQKLGGRFYLKHRWRYEQRFVEGQDLRTRYRYNLFINIPLNKPEIEEKVAYIALYNELFINGQREVAENTTVEIFDRNRAYGALGYAIKSNIKVQTGIMRQITDGWAKTQLQVSVHATF